MMQVNVIDECGSALDKKEVMRAVRDVDHAVEYFSGLILPPVLTVRLVSPRTLRRANVRLLRAVFRAVEHYPDTPPAAIHTARLLAVPAIRLATRMAWRGIAGQFFPSVMDGVPQIMLCPKALRLAHVNARGLRLTLAHELTHAAQEHARPQTMTDVMARTVSTLALSADQMRAQVADGPQFSTVMEGHAQWTHLRVCRELYGRDMRERSTWTDGPGSWSYRAAKNVALMNPVIKRKDAEYDTGEAFIAAVFASGGMSLVNRVWTGLDAVPSRRELDDPRLWIERVGSDV